MTAELTAEQIVTNILTSNEIIRRREGNFYISNPAGNLGEFLLKEPIKQTQEEICEEEPSKYTFIKGSWNI